MLTSHTEQGAWSKRKPVERSADAVQLTDEPWRCHGLGQTIQYDSAKSALKYRVGDRIAITEPAFVRLCEAFLTDIESNYA